ncbi:MAG: hypothetical protein ISQ84_06525 [Pelagibacterales bacterium]|jgi:hypothetical protein|nr:hypothetical protein [Pelagibacterales bacterium]
MFNTEKKQEDKRKVNLAIKPEVYEEFKKATKERLQTKSWVVENFMKSYTLKTNK